MAESQTQQTTQRFRVCETCGEVFYTVRSISLHQAGTDHDGVDHITAEVQE